MIYMLHVMSSCAFPLYTLKCTRKGYVRIEGLTAVKSILVWENYQNVIWNDGQDGHRDTIKIFPLSFLNSVSA